MTKQTVEFCSTEIQAKAVADYYYSLYSYYMKKKYGKPEPHYVSYEDGSSTWLVWHY